MKLDLAHYKRLSRDDKIQMNEWLHSQGIVDAFEIEWDPNAGTSVPVTIRAYRRNAEGKKFLVVDDHGEKVPAKHEYTRLVTDPVPEITIR